MHRANGFTRQEILTTIKLNGSMTADGLGKELGISPVAVRQHLSALQAEGMISTSIERRGLGRPVHRYSITSRGDETFPRKYQALANAVLEELRMKEGEGAVDSLLASRRERFANANVGRLSGKALPARIDEMARIQTECGFMAAVESDGDDFLLIEHNCAFCEVARNNRAVCAQELEMLREMVGEAVAVVRERYIMDGDHTCTYRIRQESASAAQPQ